MESKIRKQTFIYGLAAILLASVLAAVILSVDIIQLEYTPGTPPVSAPQSPLLSAFQSDEELKSFLRMNSKNQGPFWIYGPEDAMLVDSLGSALFYESYKSGIRDSAAPSHSTTNIQVAGVDEADIVKVDNKGYMYALSGNVVYILKAYPETQAEIVSRITFDDLHPIGIFVNGDKLAVLGSEYHFPTIYDRYYVADIKTFVKVYDVSDPDNPLLLRNLIISGSYFNSRMIGNYVYFVVSKAAYLVNGTLHLPEINSDGKVIQIAPTEIRYFNATDDYYQYTTFVAMNMQNITESPVYLPIMLGGTCNMYVSLSNIYVTYRGWSWNGNTTIYRIRVQGSNMTCEARGTVPGHERNQFSMDECNDYFRIETTIWTQTYQTNLYVLNMNLSVVGKLEGLAPGENFHSARFMGNRAYFVTFKKTDPLFVINLSEPTNPSVLGELHIPGYSDYLHPYDETHLIGVGKHTVEAEEGDFAWYQGIKMSLFDVSNVTNPVQIDNVTIGDRGSDSPVLYDHKSFLFDKSKNLLVIPILEAKIDISKYSGEVPPYAYGEPIWQGAYVFDLSLFHGFVLKGRITHLINGMSIQEKSYWVKRSLYIEDVLYTISSRKIKLNMLDDLSPIREIELP